MLGITFLRFKNEEIYKDLNGVLENIKLRVIDLLKNPPAPLS
jgi:very-short-patch-repair endonuclease